MQTVQEKDILMGISHRDGPTCITRNGVTANSPDSRII